MSVPTPKEISRNEAGNTDPDLGGDIIPGGNDVPNVDNPVPPKKDEQPAFDPKDFVKKSDYEKTVSQRDRNYARMKKAEEMLKEKGIDFEDEPAPAAPAKPYSTDAFSIAKTVSALKDFDEREIDFAQTIAQAKNVTAPEAVQTEEFKTWLLGKRSQESKGNDVPRPGTRGAPTPGLPDATKIGQMSKDEHAKLERDFLAKQDGRGGGI